MKSLTRRAVLTAGGLGALAGVSVVGSSILPTGSIHARVVAGRPRAGIPTETTIQWGQDSERQSGHLFLPDAHHWGDGSQTPTYRVIMFIHGGGWTDRSSPAYCRDVAEDLARYGVAVWLPTYRGTPSPGGWPMTFHDVSDALDYISHLGEHADFHPDLKGVHVVGHSAGGHLAAWVAARDQIPGFMSGGRERDSGGQRRIAVRSATPLAGVLDCEKAVYEDDDQWVVRVMGGRPEEQPDRYKVASPIHHLPLATPVNVLHGKDDSVVPVSTVRDYVATHQRTANLGRVMLLEGVGHNDFVHVNHPAWSVAREVCLKSVDS